jgi:uncharacterized protein (TIRG00374 family)
MRVVRLLLLAAGLASVAYLIVATGLETLLSPVRTLSWRVLVVIVVPYAIVAVLHTLGWRCAFTRAVGLGRLFAVRLAGEALNVTMASVGGEPVKVYLLRGRVPVVEASATVVLDKTTITVAQGVFLAIGLGLAWAAERLPPWLFEAAAWLLVIEILAVAGFVLVQLAGVFGRATRVLNRLGLALGQDQLGRIDRALAAFYRQSPARLAAAILCHLLGWVAGSLEIYLLLLWLGVPVTVTDALLIEALGTAVAFVAFMVPARLGAFEGGHMVIFSALGLGAGLGLSLALIRRLRVILWCAIGVLILALGDRRPAGAGVPAVVTPAGSGVAKDG